MTKYGFANSSGETLISPRFDYAADYSEGRAAILVDSQFGYLDDRGATVIAPQYQSAGNFHQGLAAVKKEGKWGFVGPDGKTAIPFQYDQVYEFADGYAPVRVGKLWGYIDPKGGWLVTPQFEHAYAFGDGLAYVNYSDFIDTNGKLVIKGIGNSDRAKFKNGFLSTQGQGHGAPQMYPITIYDKKGREVASFSVQSPMDGGYSPVTDLLGYEDGYEGPVQEGLAVRKEKGKYGFVDAKGKWVIAPRFLNAERFSEELAAVRDNIPNPSGGPNRSLLGYIDHKGKFAILPAFVDGTAFHEGIAQVVVPSEKDGNSGTWGTFIDKKGKALFKVDYEEINPFSNGLARVLNQHQFFFIDQKGETQIAGPFDEAKDFESGLAIVENDQLWGYIDPAGKYVLGPTDYVGPVREGKICFREKALWGYRDESGKTVITPQFEGARSFSEGLAVVEADGKMGTIDSQGKWVSEIQGWDFEDLKEFKNGLLPVPFYGEKKKKRKKAGGYDDWDAPVPQWGFIDLHGKLVIPARFDQCNEFNEGLACARSKELWGFLDPKGNWVIKPRFKEASVFSEGLAPVSSGKRGEGLSENGKYGYINKKEKWVIPPQFFMAQGFGNGIAFVYFEKGGVRIPGFIDKTGRSTKKDLGEADCFSCLFKDGLSAASIEKNGKKLWGLIDEKGIWKILPIYEAIGNFHEGMAAVCQGRQWGFIDKTGKVVVPFLYDSTGAFSEGLAWVHTNWNRKDDSICGGYVDTSGHCAIHSDDFTPFDMGEMSDFKNGSAHVLGRHGYQLWIDKQGNILEKHFDNGWFHIYAQNYREENPESETEGF